MKTIAEYQLDRLNPNDVLDMQLSGYDVAQINALVSREEIINETVNEQTVEIENLQKSKDRLMNAIEKWQTLLERTAETLYDDPLDVKDTDKKLETILDDMHQTFDREC